MSHLSLEELELIDEPKYRNYINSVDKALKNFEYTSEWADLISALGKLNKVLQSHSKFNIIPRRVIIAKRLAQCLHPALPSGVHLKALETYDLIFKLVGAARLSNELFIYSAGLYPLLAHAALNVRPVLLTLYEVHLVPIAEYLKPGLSGFLNGVLPGLEEGADHYDRTSTLLDKICSGVTSSVFYGCLWKCVAENSQIRLPAYTYILAHFDRKRTLEDQIEILGQNVDLMIHSLCISLEDASVLVQRSALEFLLAAFPLHGSFLLQPDIVQLLAAAITALLRRDMSLNRRLFSWLLGYEGQSHLLNGDDSLNKSNLESETNNSYFQQYSKILLIEALQCILKNSCTGNKVADLRPYRVLISLLEKPEIGPTILDDILLDVFRSLYFSSHSKHQRPKEKAQHDELIKTANLLFGTLEESYVWSFTGRQLQKSCSIDADGSSDVQQVGRGAAHFLEMCKITTFLLDMLSVDSSSDTQVEYLPSLLVQTADLLHASYGSLDVQCVGAGIELCRSLLKKILPAHEAEEWAGSFGNPSDGGVEEATEMSSGDFHSPPSSPALVSSSQHQKQLLELAVVGVQQLLAKLLNPGVFRLDRIKLLQQARLSLALPPIKAEPALERLLDDCIIKGKKLDSLRTDFAQEVTLTEFPDLELVTPEELDQLLPIVKQCCLLLKDLSSFPTYCAAAMVFHQVISADQDWMTLPDWLQLLCLACCCSSDTKLSQFYLSASSALLDLTTLTSSMIPMAFWSDPSASKDKQEKRRDNVPSDVYTVVLLPVLTPTQLLTLTNKSRVYQLLAERLWRDIGPTMEFRQQCVELLHQLHTLSPPFMNNIAEDVILRSLNQQMKREDGCMSAVEKFTIIWHLGRDLEPTRKTFDRCLFLLLDWLSLDPSPQKTVAENWLIQTLLRNDLSRVLDPVLLKLLQPHSARVSIRHVTVQPSDADNQEQEIKGREDDIYAISSEDGHVIYHVTPSRGNTNSRAEPFITPRRSVLTLGEGRSAPESFVDRQVIFPWQLPQHQIIEQTVGLFVNPFPDDSFLVPGAAPKSEPTESEANIITNTLLDELIQTVVNKAVAAAAAARSKLKHPNSGSLDDGKKISAIHPLHNHLLLYCQVSDAQQTLHMLQTIRSQLLCQPRLLLLNLASTGIASSRSPHSGRLQELLARHRKCLFGNGFTGEVSADWMAPHRSSMYLEVILQLLLYHLRTFYSSLGVSSLTRQEIMANRQVQLYCIKLLILLLNELLPLVRDSGKGFSSYVCDLLNRCRLQKVALHCTLASLHVITMDRNRTAKNKPIRKQQRMTLTEEIVLFNEEGEDNSGGSTYSEANLISLTKLLLSIMALEDQLIKQSCYGDLATSNNGSNSASSINGVYQRGVPVHSQSLFMTAVLTAFKQKSIRWLHTEFTRLLAASLPLMGKSLPTILNAVVPQLCHNLESIATFPGTNNPPDYLITELEALTALCHFVLVDSVGSCGAPTLAGSAGLLGGLGWTTATNGTPNSSSNGNERQILHNLVHAFTPNGAAVIFNGNGNNGDGSSDPYSTARRQMLSNLPRILVCIGSLWQMSSSDKLQRQKLLEFVSPIGHQHGASLLAAVSVAWVEKGKEIMSPINSKSRKVIPECGPEQWALVDLVSSVRVLPPDTLVQLLRQVLKQPMQMQLHNRSSRLEVGLLHFFYAYLQKINRVQLGECWGSLLQLLRDITATVSPPILFAGLVVFGEAVQRYQTPGEKRDQRELQEVTGKLLEACGNIAAACLEQTTWLRRNLTVRRDLTTVAPAAECDETGSVVDEGNSSSTSSSEALASEEPAVLVPVSMSATSKASRYSIQALEVLAELLAPLQDLIFPSQDKERVIPLLTSLLANVIPYLKHHSQTNIGGMRAASLLLSSLSDFPATRRAWRRDAFELLLDPTFFAFDVETLRHWRNIIDNLMCHDKDAFREFLGRVSVSPSGLFSSRELEMEMRTTLLKRLAFTLFCTDGDQYQRYLPEIQEKLSESLRLAQMWPSVQAQVFLCFRVLLLRTSQQHVTSLWPSVIAETVQVLSQLEHELRRDTEEFSSQIRRLGALDSTWVTSSSNGLQGHAHPAWLHLYLSTCKLLHLALVLPATRLPQFQMYRWAFVGDESLLCEDGDISTSSRPIQQVTPNFVPYLSRIYKLLRNKVETSKTYLPASTGLEDLVLPSANTIKSLVDLMPFFDAIEQRGPRVRLNEDVIISNMENILERDFLEPIPT